ncbi:MAG: hypothetical protein SNG27_02910 [Rikenellaceae bacterium]
MKRVLILISSIVVGGCVASQQSVVTDVDVMGWGDPKYVIMNNKDTSTLRNIELFVRYSPSLVDDSVTLTINTMAPDSLTFSEEVKLYFDSSATERSASIVENFPYRNNVVWSQQGSYHMEITPTTPISGIEAVGVTITKTTQ